MIDNSHLEVYHRTAKVRKGGSELASALLTLAGLIFLIPLFPIGLVLLACAWLVRTKYEKVDWCDACGNHISPTCLICPTCSAQILTPPKPPFWRWPVICAFAFALLLILAVIIAALSRGGK